ncbi:hypothetical protein M3J09_010133 [Ascochyta lentis]
MTQSYPACEPSCPLPSNSKTQLGGTDTPSPRPLPLQLSSNGRRAQSVLKTIEHCGIEGQIWRNNREHVANNRSPALLAVGEGGRASQSAGVMCRTD